MSVWQLARSSNLPWRPYWFSEYDMLTNTKLRVVFPRWPIIGFKTSSYQTTSCSIESYFSDPWCLHVCSWMSNPVIYRAVVRTIFDLYRLLTFGHNWQLATNNLAHYIALPAVDAKNDFIINKYLNIWKLCKHFSLRKLTSCWRDCIRN